MEEVWKALPEYEGRYEVSSIGRLRVSGIDQLGRKRHLGRILAVKFNRDGYLRYFISQNSNRKNITAHLAVALAFLGPRQEGLYVNHKNGDKTDNRVENLEYVTSSENYRHALDVLGHRPPSGANHWSAKLTDDQVKDIQRRALNGEKHKDLAQEFGCSKAAVSLYRNGISRTSVQVI